MRIAFRERVALANRAVRCRRAVGVVLAGVTLGVFGVGAPAVAAPSGAWLVRSTVAPTYIAPGGTGTITVAVENVGDATVSGTVTPVVVKDVLPAGLEVTEMSGRAGSHGNHGVMSCSVAEVSCEWSQEPLEEYEALYLELSVKAAANAVSGVSEVAVSGGGVPDVSARQPVTVSGAPVPFGLQGYGFRLEGEGGVLDTQAGSHPFQLTTALSFNETAQEEKPPAIVRDLSFALPRGLTGNPTQVPQCTNQQFLTIINVSNLCPADTAVGVATLMLNSAGSEVKATVPVFNMQPAGEPARFAFIVVGVPVFLDVSLRTGGDYGVTVTSSNNSQAAEVVSAQVTLWGVPGDPRHDASRGWNCVDGGVFAEGPCTPLGASSSQPLLTVPTSCTGPLQSSVSVTSWPTRANPEGITTPSLASDPVAGLEGCERLPFTPELQVTPETQLGNTPTGLGVDLRIPQFESPEGIASGNLKKAVVTLPEGVVVNPGAATGLGACTPQEIGLSSAGPVSCPASAKVGTAEAVSPSLKDPLVGSVYVAQQANNPFGSLLALYLVLEGEGLLVKSAGEVHLDPVTGQITATFDEIPQQATSDIKLSFFGGPRATLLTPPGCGTYTTTSQLTPYNSLIPVEPSSAFQITSAANGSGCGPQGFTPAVSAGTENNQAGAFSPFDVSLSRQDQDQDLGGLTVKTPPGLEAILAGVERCPEPQASQGTCGAGSLIGHATVLAGAGPDPVSVAGKVFLTGPYKGGPFGLSVVVPAVAGPFNLGDVVVRAAINVDPQTAQITVTSDPLPTILQGIPLHVKGVNVAIDRQGFMFNPTNCEPFAVGGTVMSTQGATANVSDHFQAANCAALGFKPSFTASTQAATSKKNGASLDVKVGYPKGAQANIHSVAVSLPKQLPSRLTTIQQACPAATFNANPASCPVGSNIGVATATTPILSSAVSGPAYLVSHGGAAFPDVVVILQAEGVTVDLVGSIDIKHGVTSSTFASVPDVPISSFELRLPEGSHSGLAAVLPAKAKGNMCGQKLTMPTTLTGQNGAVVKQTTKIAVTGCSANTRRAHGKKPKHAKAKRKAKKKKG